MFRGWTRADYNTRGLADWVRRRVDRGVSPARGPVARSCWAAQRIPNRFWRIGSCGERAGMASGCGLVVDNRGGG